MPKKPSIYPDRINEREESAPFRVMKASASEGDVAYWALMDEEERAARFKRAQRARTHAAWRAWFFGKNL